MAVRTPARILATRLWWRHALHVTKDPSHEAFLQRFSSYTLLASGYGLEPRSLMAWERGRCCVSEGTVRRVENRVPGTKHVFLLGCLLEPKRHLSAPEARRLISDYTCVNSSGAILWRFPDDVKRNVCGDLPLAWNDSELLAQRGDVFGLLAILALLREAMAAWSSHDDAQRHVKNLYRALPSVLRLPWVMPDGGCPGAPAFGHATDLVERGEHVRLSASVGRFG